MSKTFMTDDRLKALRDKQIHLRGRDADESIPPWRRR
jgi:hypothetical protein